MRLLPLLLPTPTVGLRFSRVQGEDAESKPAYCRLREETRAGMEIKGWSETVRECGSRSRLALCRLPSDATHSAHYNKAVVCSARSVQQGDKVLPLYQKQLQRGKKVLEQEISSFEFSLSLSFPSSSQTETASPSSHTVRAVVVPAGICLSASGDCAGWVPGWASLPEDLAPGLGSQSRQWGCSQRRAPGCEGVEVAQTHHSQPGLELLMLLGCG